MRTTLSWPWLAPTPASAVVIDSTAMAAARLNQRMFQSSVTDVVRVSSGLQRLPDRVANHDRPWNETQLEEAIGHTLRGGNDVVGDRADRKGRAVGGNRLDVEGNAGDRAQRSCYLFTVRFGPVRGRRRHVDDLLQDRTMVLREIAVGDIERVGPGDL